MADPDTPKPQSDNPAGPQGRYSKPYEAAHPKDHDGSPMTRPPSHFKPIGHRRRKRPMSRVAGPAALIPPDGSVLS